mgnify:FL=1
MKIKEIKISDELMGGLVLMFFKTEEINNKRREQNIINQMKFSSWGIESIDIPMLTTSIKQKINISEEDAIKSFDLLNKRMINNKLPYFSLISDNSTNDLQVYLNSYDGEQVTTEDLSSKSKSCYMVDDKYTFINL